MQNNLKEQIIQNEDYFVQVLNYISTNGYTVGKGNKGNKCPHHSINTNGSDSFTWKQTTDGTWIGGCWSCGLKGNIIDIYAKVYGINTKDKQQFNQLLKDIAGICGISYTDNTVPVPTLPFKNNSIPKVKERSKDEVQTILNTIEQAHNNVADTDYFYKRGFTDDTINKYKLGYLKECVVKGFNNGPGAVVPYPGEDYYFTRLIAPKGKLQKIFLKDVPLPIFNSGCIKDNNIIWVTEGQFDCLSILQLGFNCIGTNSTTGNNKLVDYIKSNNITNKVFIVAYDNDDPGLKGADKLIQLLKEQGLHTVQYIPTGGKDINEMLVNCKEQLLQDIKKVQQEAQELLNTPVSTPKNYITDKGLDIGALVLYTTNNNIFYRQGNLLYKYNDSTGIYDVIREEDIQQQYYQIAREEGTTKDIDHKKCDKFTKTLFQIVPYHVQTMDEMRYIACTNGIIDSVTNELLEFNPKYKLDCKFNGNFNPNYDEWLDKYRHSKFKAFLKDILVDDDVIWSLQEMWGNMLCPHSSKIQQIFIYLGNGSNGKSSLFDIQEALLGSKEQNVCGISLEAFSDRFTLSMAQGKRINIVRDDVLVSNVGGKFKSAITGEPVTTEQKNKDHIRQSFNMAWFYGVNELPNTSDKSTGYYRRNCIIPFKVKFGTSEEVQRGVADKIKVPGIVNSIIEEELDIIFMWAYWGLQRLIKQNFVITPNGASNEAMEEYKEDTNSAYMFYKHMVDPKIGKIMFGSELYNYYLQWCQNEHYQPMSSVKFGKQIKEFGVSFKRTNKGIVYFNIDVEPIPVTNNNVLTPQNNKYNKDVF